MQLPEYGLTLVAGPNVFAHDKFDIGARFFLEQFDKLPKAQHIADLGCGNGVLGIVAKQKMPTEKIEFLTSRIKPSPLRKQTTRQMV